MSEMKTFVFTDIVQSVTLKGQMAGTSDAERDRQFVDTILTPHRQRIERQLNEHGGRVVSTAGDGHFLVFANTIEAAKWAIGVQRGHRAEPVDTPTGRQVEVRMSLHVGFPQADPNDPHNFIGRVVDYAARLNDYAASGQVLISSAALGLLKDAGLDGVAFHSHGHRDLRGIGAVDVHELLYDGGEPTPTRRSPSESVEQREWTILPATMGLTEYAKKVGSSGKLGGNSGNKNEDGSGGSIATPTVPSPDHPQQRLGNYTLGPLLGAGGKGNVYKARHTQFDRDRAVKVIKPHLIPHADPSAPAAGDHHEEIIRRFYREIKAIGALDHPNIVVAIDSSAPGDATHYLVMEYVDGVGADDLVTRGGPMPIGAACEVARQAALGLEYIHRQAMVHRDIKPSNLMLTLVNRSSLDGVSPATGDAAGAAPVVKILDLGLALLVTDDQPRLTQMGHGAMGTAMYMSPEQWNTTSVDIRSDIYSLGCTLYHLISGRPPFYDSDLRPQRAHELAPVPGEFGRKDVPKSLKKLIQKMMAKRPDERFTRPAEVADALAKLASADDLATVVDRHRRLGPELSTRQAAGGETLSASAAASDTLGPLPPAPMEISWPAARPQSLWRRMVMPALILAALATAGWMASIASDNRSSLEEARRQNEIARRQNLIVPAGLAASSLAKEIDDRFEILTRLSQDAPLQIAMQTVDTGDRSTWSGVQAWIERRKKASDSRVASDSWFLVAADGVQIARAKPSKSIGRSFAWRDYFHGGGQHLEPGVSAEPIQGPRQSVVYRSTSTQKLKVAFSVPVWGPASGGDPPQVIGVLGMSVDLGKFRVLEDAKRLPKNLEVVLIDLRRDHLDPQDDSKRGLVLHHPELDQYEVPTDPFRLPPELLSQVDTALARATRSGSPSDPIIKGYADLLRRPGKGTYVGAFEPVVIRNPDEQRNTEWLVIVQQAMN